MGGLDVNLNQVIKKFISQNNNGFFKVSAIFTNPLG